MRYAALVELSGLGTEEIELVRDAWPRIVPDRRLTLVTRLVETSEDNVDLDFSQIFKLALKDDGENVRAKAVSGLWECEERPLMTALLRLLHYDPSMEVRTAAAQAMGKYAELAEDGKLLPSDSNRIKTALLPLVEDEGRPLGPAPPRPGGRGSLQRRQGVATHPMGIRALRPANAAERHLRHGPKRQS